MPEQRRLPLHHTAVLNNAGYKWRVLMTGALANTCFAFVIGGVPAVSLTLRNQYGLSSWELGLVMGVMGFGIAISEIPWGMATDRIGDRPVLLTGLIMTAAALYTLSYRVETVSHESLFTVLFTGLLITGFVGSSINGSSGKAIMQWFRPNERGLAMSIRQTSVPLGYALGAIGYPLISMKIGFSWALGISAMACTVAALFSYLWIIDPSEPDQKHAAKPTRNAGNKLKLPVSKALWRMVSAIGLLCAPQFALMTFTMIFLHDFSGISVASISIMLFLIQASAIVTRIGSGHYTDRTGNRKAFLRFMAVINFILFLALSLITHLAYLSHSPIIPYLLTVLVLLSGITISAWHGVGYTELAGIAGPKNVATALAMGNAAVFLVLFATPATIPWLLRHTSWTWVWGSMAMICAIAYRLFGVDDQERR